MEAIKLQYRIKNKIALFFLCLIVAIVFTACGDDDPVEPAFSGSDNYIVSFQLTKDGITWPVAISGTELVVNVPLNTNLNGATAQIVLTESTTISPNPQEIKDWSADWQFLVTSLQEKDRVYKYSVEYTDMAAAGDVVLNTQQEVNDFAGTGIRKIHGNLIIGSESGENFIENLDGLNKLEEITGILRILNTYTGSDLMGLQNLQSVGSLAIGEVNTLSSNTSLTQINMPALKKIKENLFIHSQTIEKLILESVTTIGGTLFITSDKIEDINMPLLEIIEGDVIISGTTGESPEGSIEYLYLPSLETIGGCLSVFKIASLTGIGFNNIKSVGNIQFSSLPLFSSIVMNELKSAGNIIIEDCEVMQGISLPSVITCGTINIDGCSSLYTLMFDQLVECKGDIRINLSYSLQDLSGFGNLEIIEGELYLHALWIVPNIQGMKKLKKVSNITLSYLSGLEEVDVTGIEFNSLEILSSKSPSIIKGPENFTGSITVQYLNTYGGDMPVFQGFKYFNGDLTLRNFSTSTRVFELSMPDIEYITNLTLATCTYCYTIDAPALKEIGEALSITNGRMAVDFPVLERIGKQITIVTATNMAGYNFPELKTIGDGTVSGNIVTLPLIGYDIEFPKLQEINGSVAFSPASVAAATLKSIKCPLLKTITGNLQIGSTTTNTTVNELNFDALTSVTGNVTIQRFSALTNFTTFSGLINNIQPTQWSVVNCGYNPTWEQMKNGEYLEF